MAWANADVNEFLDAGDKDLRETLPYPTAFMHGGEMGRGPRDLHGYNLT